MHAVRPVLFDLCCKAGGAGKGYYDAGFDVVGFDVEPQPNYPFAFVQADVLDVLLDVFEGRRKCAAIHASPPCQAYTTGGRVKNRDTRPRLIEPIRDALSEIHWRLQLPWAIENVAEAPLRNPVVLCGSMFGLHVRRHRLFEVSFECERPRCSAAMHRAQGAVAGVYGRPHGKAGAWKGMLPGNLETWSAAMGIDWMTTDELAQAIPPAYTQWIGERMIKAVTPCTL